MVKRFIKMYLFRIFYFFGSVSRFHLKLLAKLTNMRKYLL